MERVEISSKGTQRAVRSARIGSHTIVVRNDLVPIAEIRDGEFQPEPVEDPAKLSQEIRERFPRAALFTFSQRIPETEPKFHYPHEWDNFAIIPITTYEDWWENRVPQETRKNVRRAGRRNVTTRLVQMDDELARGIKSIYDETPLRQGRRFWHYGKDLEVIRRENSTFPERSAMMGAYFEGELIGFLKMVFTGRVSSILQIISKNAHVDKRPSNALLAKAVEVCVAEGMSYLVYGQYIYGHDVNAPLVEFKRRNGFEQILVPRYYIPLTATGRLALRLGAHRGLRNLLPKQLENELRRLRTTMYSWYRPRQKNIASANS